MKDKIKKLWIAALVSGKYKQTSGNLRDSKGHCCLGVLGDIAVKAGVCTRKKCSDGVFGYGSKSEHKEYEAAQHLLPPSLVKWAGLDSCDGGDVEIDGNTQSLAGHNDGGQSFLQIAAAIERNL